LTHYNKQTLDYSLYITAQ